MVETVHTELRPSQRPAPSRFFPGRLRVLFKRLLGYLVLRWNSDAQRLTR